jgi:hypothetical protein
MDREAAFKALFGKRALKWPEAKILEATAALSPTAGWVDTFVCEMVRLAPPGQTAASWAEALGLLAQLRTLDVQVPTSSPQVLAALQQATRTEVPTIPVILALLREGSVESWAAAEANLDRLARCELPEVMLRSHQRELKRYGKGVPRVEALLKRVEQELAPFKP